MTCRLRRRKNAAVAHLDTLVKEYSSICLKSLGATGRVSSEIANPYRCLFKAYKLTRPACPYDKNQGKADRLHAEGACDDGRHGQGHHCFVKNGLWQESLRFVTGTTRIKRSKTINERARGCSRYNRCVFDKFSVVAFTADFVVPGFLSQLCRTRKTWGVLENVQKVVRFHLFSIVYET